MCKEIILGPVKKLQLDFRQGAIEFLKMLSKEKIPLLIFSAGAGDIIHESLKKNKLWASNIHIVSNFFKYDTSGKAVSYTMPLIHPFNKNESCVKKSKYKSQIAKRKNVILLGDSLGDLTMAKGMKHDCIIKIGFYNHEYDKERISKHKKGYDVIITGNKDMRYANWLLKEIIKG
jgi:5'-nucleotidase